MGFTEEEITSLLDGGKFPLLLPEDAAVRLGITAPAVLKLAKSGKITYVRFSSRIIRFDLIDLLLYADPTALDRAEDERTRRALAKRLPYVTTFIYFMQTKQSRRVKVGIARDVKKRLKGIQNGNPETISVLHSFRGDRDVERALHHALRPWRLRGEWFSWSDPLKKAIGKLKAGGDLIDVVAELCEAADRLDKAGAR